MELINFACKNINSHIFIHKSKFGDIKVATYHVITHSPPLVVSIIWRKQIISLIRTQGGAILEASMDFDLF